QTQQQIVLDLTSGFNDRQAPNALLHVAIAQLPGNVFKRQPTSLPRLTQKSSEFLHAPLLCQLSVWVDSYNGGLSAIALWWERPHPHSPGTSPCPMKSISMLKPMTRSCWPRSSPTTTRR